MHQEPWWSAGHLLMLSRCIFNCKEFHMPLKTLFSKYDFSAHLLLSILTVPSILGCIMETCFYLNLLSRILTLPTSLLYFQTTWFLFHHELYSCFTLASSFLCSTQLDFFLFFTRMQTTINGNFLHFLQRQQIPPTCLLLPYSIYFCWCFLFILTDLFWMSWCILPPGYVYSPVWELPSRQGL